jgi:hypothetical protein
MERSKCASAMMLETMATALAQSVVWHQFVSIADTSLTHDQRTMLIPFVNTGLNFPAAPDLPASMSSPQRKA